MVVLKLKETLSDDLLGHIVPPCNPSAARCHTIKVKLLRGKKQAPLNDEKRFVCCCRGNLCLFYFIPSTLI